MASKINDNKIDCKKDKTEELIFPVIIEHSISSKHQKPMGSDEFMKKIEEYEKLLNS